MVCYTDDNAPTLNSRRFVVLVVLLLQLLP